MTIQERATALVGDMPWITTHLSLAQVEDLKKQIAASMRVAVLDAVRLLPTERQPVPLVYTLELDDSYQCATPKEIANIEAGYKESLPPGAYLVVTQPGMKLRAVAPPRFALVHLWDDISVDAAKVVSVEVNQPPVQFDAYPQVKVVWQEHDKQAHCAVLGVPKGIEAAQRLARDIRARVNRARLPGGFLPTPAGTKFTPLKLHLKDGQRLNMKEPVELVWAATPEAPATEMTQAEARSFCDDLQAQMFRALCNGFTLMVDRSFDLAARRTDYHVKIVEPRERPALNCVKCGSGACRLNTYTRAPICNEQGIVTAALQTASLECLACGHKFQSSEQSRSVHREVGEVPPEYSQSTIVPDEGYDPGPIHSDGLAAVFNTTGSRALAEYERLALELHTLVMVENGDNTGAPALAIRAEMDRAWTALTYDEQLEAEQYARKLREGP